MRGPCPGCLSSPFKKLSLGVLIAALNHWLFIHAISQKSQESIIVMGSHGPLCLPDPGSYSTSVTLLVGICFCSIRCATSCVCVCVCSLVLPNNFVYPGCSQSGSGDSLPREGRELLSYCLWPGSMDAGATAAGSTTTGIMSGDFPCPHIKPPYWLFCSIFYTLWLPNFLSAKIALTVHFIFWKIS